MRIQSGPPPKPRLRWAVQGRALSSIFRPEPPPVIRGFLASPFFRSRDFLNRIGQEAGGPRYPNILGPAISCWGPHANPPSIWAWPTRPAAVAGLGAAGRQKAEISFGRPGANSAGAFPFQSNVASKASMASAEASARRPQLVGPPCQRQPPGSGPVGPRQCGRNLKWPCPYQFPDPRSANSGSPVVPCPLPSPSEAQARVCPSHARGGQGRQTPLLFNRFFHRPRAVPSEPKPQK